MRHEGGMTLVEVLVTLLLLLVGIGGLVALHAATTEAGRFARDTTTAATLALSKAEELRLVTPVPTGGGLAACTAVLPCSAGAGEVVDDSGVPSGGGRFTRCWCTLAAAPDQTLRVLVAWNDAGATPHSCAGATHCVQMDLRRAP